tara:strand:- start:281 stop:529 length:249 start_codon:yes stop_codon:yes gene_type:complete
MTTLKDTYSWKHYIITEPSLIIKFKDYFEDGGELWKEFSNLELPFSDAGIEWLTDIHKILLDDGQIILLEFICGATGFYAIF